jgi:hypothetical protein
VVQVVRSGGDLSSAQGDRAIKGTFFLAASEELHDFAALHLRAEEDGQVTSKRRERDVSQRRSHQEHFSVLSFVERNQPPEVHDGQLVAGILEVLFDKFAVGHIGQVRNVDTCHLPNG